MNQDDLPVQAAYPESTPKPDSTVPRRRRALELWLAGAFTVVHLVAPVVIGERYPFTISPMFYDQPVECCTYTLTGADGADLDEEHFNLHLVYDGNPPGLGMGIEPTETLHPYCNPCLRQEVTAHVRGIMKRDGITGPITITRRHLFHKDYQIATETDQWEVSIDGPDQPAGNDTSVEPPQR